MRTRYTRAAPALGDETNEGKPFDASRLAIASASLRTVTAATCTT